MKNGIVPEEMALKLSKRRRRGSTGSTGVLQTCHKLASCVHYEKTTRTSCDRHCDLATRKATGKLIQNLKFPEENKRSILEIKEKKEEAGKAKRWKESLQERVLRKCPLLWKQSVGDQIDRFVLGWLKVELLDCLWRTPRAVSLECQAARKPYARTRDRSDKLDSHPTAGRRRRRKGLKPRHAVAQHNLCFWMFWTDVERFLSSVWRT